MKLTRKVVRELLYYNLHTGRLIWCNRDRKWFKSDGACSRWNARYAGRPAFTYRSRGHQVGMILGQQVLAHRVIWLWMKGRWPKAIAYKNGDLSDNRWANLVERKSAADARDYQRFRSGRMAGTPWKTPSGSYVARLGKQYLGAFATPREASEARTLAALKRWG